MKRNYKHIRTLDDLQREVVILKADYKGREIMLKDDASAYIKQFSIFNLLRKYTSPSGLFKLDEKTHISGKIMSMVLPLILNKTLFRGSGFITKALAAVVSGKLGSSLDAESLSGIFNTVKSLFNSKKKAKEKVKYIDYGIPPDSETY